MARKPARKVIISCAVTGAIHTPTMSDALPFRPEDIAREAIAAAEAGAAILHLHARDPETGAPTPDPAVFMRFLPVIKQATDAVVNITTYGQNGGQTTPLGQGSGFVYDESGRIVTNDHVVEGADQVEVTFSDGPIREAEVIGQDPSGGRPTA